MLSAEEMTRIARENYAICKRIDGYPEVEGTHLLMGARVTMFRYLNERQAFFEPLGSYDQLRRLTFLNARLVDGHVPRPARNRLLVSFRMFGSIYDAPRGRVPLPRPGEAEKGVHAVAVDGGYADSGESLRFVNSWGAGWGDGGRGLLSREYLDRYMVDAWLWRDARVGPSRFTQRRLAEASDDKEFGKAWTLENPRLRQRFRHTGQSHRLHLYETLSADGHPVEVIEVRNGLGWRLGWAYLHHLRGRPPRVSVLKELFVWPSFRRRGYGRLLESVAEERTRRWGSSSLRVLFHEADAMPRNRAAGRLFAGATGYKLSWRRHRLPNLSAVCEKALR